MPLRRRHLARLTIGALSAGAPTIAMFGWGAPSSAQTSCSHYAALAGAEGVRTFQSAPGLIVTDVDGNLPAAQAQADSLRGSSGWAGAPYSATAAENAGYTQQNPNDAPVFALSSHPTQPETSKSTPGLTLEARSGPRASAAKAVAGGPTSDQGSAARVSTTASASCGDDATVQAVAETLADMIDIKDVLRIGRVRSHAQAVVDPTGRRTLRGTMAVEGATVLGQPVAITNQGVVTGASGAPLPNDPLMQALTDAGISVQYIAAVKDEQRGQVIAPGLEVVVTQGIQGVGSGPASTTYVFGRAYARAAATADEVAVETPALPDVLPDPPAQRANRAPSALSPPASPSTPAVGGGVASSGAAVRTADGRQALPDVRIATASSGELYSALAVSALLLLSIALVVEKLGRRVRWR